MDMYLQALSLRIRDGFQACLAATFPSDRPSGLFAVYTSVLNGGLLVWSFSEVLGKTCSKETTYWIGFGMAHCYVNMIFGVLSMMDIRRRIACGIPAETSQWRVFYRDPLMIFYAIYLVGELVWTVAAGHYSAQLNRKGCVLHINVQIFFFVFYWLGGLLLIFQITFVTERWRRPRWRNFAAMRYDYLHNTERQRSVRWRDEHDGENVEEPVDSDGAAAAAAASAARRRREETERTSTRDYASVRDDMTAEADEGRDSVVLRSMRSNR